VLAAGEEVEVGGEARAELFITLSIIKYL